MIRDTARYGFIKYSILGFSLSVKNIFEVLDERHDDDRIDTSRSFVRRVESGSVSTGAFCWLNLKIPGWLCGLWTQMA